MSPLQVLGVEKWGVRPHDLQVQVWVLLQVRGSLHEVLMRNQNAGGNAEEARDAGVEEEKETGVALEEEK